MKYPVGIQDFQSLRQEDGYLPQIISKRIVWEA